MIELTGLLPPPRIRFEDGADLKRRRMPFKIERRPFDFQADRVRTGLISIDRAGTCYTFCYTVMNIEMRGQPGYELALYCGDPGDDDHAFLCRFRERQIDEDWMPDMMEIALGMKRERDAKAKR